MIDDLCLHSRELKISTKLQKYASKVFKRGQKRRFYYSEFSMKVRVGSIFKMLEFAAPRKTLAVGVPQEVTYQI